MKSTPHFDTGDSILVSIKDACGLLGIGTTMLYELLDDGKLESVKIGKRRLIKRASILEYVEELSQDAA